MEKIKVVWLTHFANQRVNEHVSFNIPFLTRVYRLIKRTGVNRINHEFAVWVSNAISEIETLQPNIELHVISTYSQLSPRLQSFEFNGVHYHLFKDEMEDPIRFIKSTIFNIYDTECKKNRKIITDLISDISPDIVHVIGIENPQYASAVLDIRSDIIVIAQLQTLLLDPKFLSNYPINYRLYRFRKKFEVEILKRASYIATNVEYFKTTIEKQLGLEACYLNLSLALAEKIELKECQKEFDFVYFAGTINKAGDYALEAFVRAYKKKPVINLLVVGGYDESILKSLKSILKKNDVPEQSVCFTGRLKTHEDVLHEIRKARFAILPLKIDVISGTIREAMSNGLPVVTTITPGTPSLNEKRMSVLLSEAGDHDAFANNMLRLLDSPQLADNIRKNAIDTINETYNNRLIIEKWIKAYHAIVFNKVLDEDMPEELML